MRFLLFLAGFSVAAFCVWTAFRAARSPIRHPFGWAFISLLCAPVTTFNLDTGSVHTGLFSLDLFGIGYTQLSPHGPTLLSLAFPVGAFLFLSRRRSLVAAAHPMMPENQLPK